MKIMQYTDPHAEGNRYVLSVTRHGVDVKYERAKVGGGWYVKSWLCVPWPWRKL